MLAPAFPGARRAPAWAVDHAGWLTCRLAACQTDFPGHRRQSVRWPPCCDWVGENGAGHFMKMVHNGIEYGDMQIIAEAYHLMQRSLGMSNDEMSAVFSRWNRVSWNRT